MNECLVGRTGCLVVGKCLVGRIGCLVVGKCLVGSSSEGVFGG